MKYHLFLHPKRTVDENEIERDYDAIAKESIDYYDGRLFGEHERFKYFGIGPKQEQFGEGDEEVDNNNDKDNDNYIYDGFVVPDDEEIQFDSTESSKEELDSTNDNNHNLKKGLEPKSKEKVGNRRRIIKVLNSEESESEDEAKFSSDEEVVISNSQSNVHPSQKQRKNIILSDDEDEPTTTVQKPKRVPKETPTAVKKRKSTVTTSVVTHTKTLTKKRKTVESDKLLATEQQNYNDKGSIAQDRTIENSFLHNFPKTPPQMGYPHWRYCRSRLPLQRWKILKLRGCLKHRTVPARVRPHLYT